VQAIVSNLHPPEFDSLETPSPPAPLPKVGEGRNSQNNGDHSQGET